MLAMILTNLALQLVPVIGNYHKKGFMEKLEEVVVTILFIRPIVDAYRVATNHEDDEVNITRLSELVANKGIELFTEGIPGCVLQLFVWLTNRDEAGAYALYVAIEQSERAVRTKRGTNDGSEERTLEARSEAIVATPRFFCFFLLRLVASFL